LAKLAAALSDAGVGAENRSGRDRADDRRIETRDDTAGVAIDLSRPSSTDDLAEAVATNAEVTISYYSPARDEVSDRVIVPRHVFADLGNWYLVADDDKSGERRTFRIDRIEGLTPTGRTVPTDDIVTAPRGFFVDADVPRAVLRLAPAARWVLEQYPTDEVTELSDPPGGVDVRLPVTSERWLARLLIRLGPNAEVVEPADAAMAAQRLAASMLANYR
jgi:proteasome accessory factor C